MKTDIHPYPAYKPSGVPRLGDVPGGDRRSAPPRLTPGPNIAARPSELDPLAHTAQHQQQHFRYGSRP